MAQALPSHNLLGLENESEVILGSVARPSLQIRNNNRAEHVAHLVLCLFSMHKILGSNPSTIN